jgi:hypothetical protein
MLPFLLPDGVVGLDGYVTASKRFAALTGTLDGI